MLQEVLEAIRNYFVPMAAKQVSFTIADGMISPDFGAEDGDRFLICGSRRNDGVYTYHETGITNDDDDAAAGLHDETFAGTIRVMAIPPKLITLSGEIKKWAENNRDALDSPMQSESFNGYSYTMKSGGKNGGNVPYSWRDRFENDLARWRKLSL